MKSLEDFFSRTLFRCCKNTILVWKHGDKCVKNHITVLTALYLWNNLMHFYLSYLQGQGIKQKNIKMKKVI